MWFLGLQDLIFLTVNYVLLSNTGSSLWLMLLVCVIISCEFIYYLWKLKACKSAFSSVIFLSGLLYLAVSCLNLSACVCGMVWYDWMVRYLLSHSFLVGNCICQSYCLSPLTCRSKSLNVTLSADHILFPSKSADVSLPKYATSLEASHARQPIISSQAHTV